MAAEEGQEAVYEWNFENTTELLTLYEKFPCLYDVKIEGLQKPRCER